MRRFWFLSVGCWLVGCSPQPKCTYVVCTENAAQACGQLQAAADACGGASSQSALDSCTAALETDCSEAESNAVANATGCYGATTVCAGAAKTIQACFNAETLGSDCRGAIQAQINVFLPDGG